MPSSFPGGYVPGIYVDTAGHVRASIFWHGSGSDQVVSSGVYTDNQWHSLVDTYNNGTESLYIDGTQLGAQNVQEVPYASTHGYFLGTGESDGWPLAASGWSYL